MQIANKIALKFMMWEFYCTFVMDVGFVESFVLGDVWFEKKLLHMVFIWLHELMTTYS